MALRDGENVEHSPELTSGRACAITLTQIGQNILVYALMGVIIWLCFFVAGAFLVQLFGKRHSPIAFDTPAQISAWLTIGVFIQQIFFSKKSVLGSRDRYNAAVRALD
ncbi:hypothetical protein [Massilia sp. LC238]|uniref:hypothetical protein n=1 Tax=Massilia sp. LC238 TaxID=1502852 RepID=UPI00126A1BA4|nr:hypothetical protein [Massilia sp. LC238]